MGLRKYIQKRNFKKTPEPPGQIKSDSHHKLAFVIQQHHASRMHYDFRLELDGVLKSWAVPKGPSLNPHDHHLAIKVEDHPYDYRNFEGIIPEGNYGAGNVIIWDEGWYEPRIETNDPQKTLQDELKKGHLTFILHGHKLKGEFALIEMENAKEDNAWLLIKKNDQYASTSDVTELTQSVKSSKKVDDLGAHGKISDLNPYPKRKSPWHVSPMLCTLVDEPFTKDSWLFEIKWDGYRAIGVKNKTDIQLYSRYGNNFQTKFLPIIEALRSFDHDVIIDGEIVVVDERGKAHFEWLQNWHVDQRGKLVYYIFDILWCDGRDVRSLPLIERKKLLKALLPSNSALQFSDHVEKNGLGLFKKMQEQGLEGMVAKRADSTYQEGNRGHDWLKIKTHLRQEVVIGGFTEPRGTRQFLGSLLVGVYEKGKLVYVGHSGGGIPDEDRKKLFQKLTKLERRGSPFAIEPQPNAPVHWVKPELVCEMSFHEWTSEGYMRQPVFEGMREDKKAIDVHRENPVTPSKVAAPSSDQKLQLTNLDKTFFPKHGYTKGDIADYYQSVAPYILPYLKGRPCSMLRMPNGIAGESFFQKNNDYLPKWVPSAEIFSESGGGKLHWIVGDNLGALLYMVQLGCIEINPWSSRIGHLDKPDWIVLDLDPEGLTFRHVVKVAQTVKKVCDERNIVSFPKTSGKTGLHIYIPMGAHYTYEQGKNFAHLLAIEVNNRLPDITSLTRAPAKRKNRIYVDYLQNREAQTLTAPYSLRPTPDATVSMPLHWDEIKTGLTPADFTIKNALKRIEKEGDIWKPVLNKGIDLSAILKHLEKKEPAPN